MLRIFSPQTLDLAQILLCLTVAHIYPQAVVEILEPSESQKQATFLSMGRSEVSMTCDSDIPGSEPTTGSHGPKLKHHHGVRTDLSSANLSSPDSAKIGVPPDSRLALNGNGLRGS